MAEIPKNLKCLLFPVSARVMARCAFILEMLGIVCLIVGIIGSVLDKGLGLWWPTDWIFLAIALWIYGLWWWLAAYFAAKEG